MTKKFKILYAEDLDELRELYSMAIEAAHDCEIVEFACGNDLIDYLKDHAQASLIICDHNMPNGSGSDVYRFLRKTNSKIPFGLMSSDDYTVHEAFKNFIQDNSLNFSETKPFKMQSLMSKISKALGGSTVQTILAEYIPIKMDRFEKFGTLTVDAYIKSGESFVKLLSVGDLYSREHHGKHREKYGNFLYVLKEQYLNLFDACIHRLKQESHPKFEACGLELVHQYVNTLGIDPKVISIVDAIFQSVVNNLKAEKNELLLLLEQLEGHNGYLYEHSLLLAYVSCSIAQKTSWNNELYYQKFVTSALLHDLGLNDEESKVNLYSEILDQKLPWDIAKKITDHPENTNQILSKMSGLSQDVSTIILSHHERPNGKGFPKGLNPENTPPLACLFIIAEEFVSRVMKQKPDSNFPQNVCKEMEVEFNVGNYKKPFEALKSMLGS